MASRPSEPNVEDVRRESVTQKQGNRVGKSVGESSLSFEMEKEFTHRRIRNSISNSTDTGLEDNTEDPWAIVELPDNSVRWSDVTTKVKIFRVVTNITKLIVGLGFLYLFICSLDLLSKAFRLISGKTAGEIFQRNELMQNPVVGLMIGILVTVLVQSSSTSTSIVVSMVGAEVITVHMAIPIIMGANIGTSATNTIVSFTQIANRNEFRRAFAGATVHDVFNWLSVIVLFTVEVVTQPIFGIGYLEWLSGALVKGVKSSSGDGEVRLLNVIIDPFVDHIILLDSKVLQGWVNKDPLYENASLIKLCGPNITEPVPCTESFLFENTGLEDWVIGLILFFISLFMLCGCLIGLVKILNSIMKGHIANLIKRVINAKIPYVPWITGYIAIFVGAAITFLVQSSSVFTSTLTPLVGIGVISIERVYPLTLGSNIGTTTTALIAALAAAPDKLRDTLQIALVHFFFSITGILLFYPIPFMRFPIPVAKFLGNETAKYRWFAIIYLVGMFFLLPGVVLGLSIAGTVAFLCVGIPLLTVVIAIAIIKIMQKKKPSWLPKVMRDWKWLPVGCRSLEPYDRQFAKCACCNRFRQSDEVGGFTIAVAVTLDPSGEVNKCLED